MDVNLILQLAKARLGITIDKRDFYITKIIEGVIKELKEEKKIRLSRNDMNQIMFICDLVVWRYQNRDNVEDVPRHLTFRLHSLMISKGGPDK